MATSCVPSVQSDGVCVVIWLGILCVLTVCSFQSAQHGLILLFDRNCTVWMMFLLSFLTTSLYRNLVVIAAHSS